MTSSPCEVVGPPLPETSPPEPVDGRVSPPTDLVPWIVRE